MSVGLVARETLTPLEIGMIGVSDAGLMHPLSSWPTEAALVAVQRRDLRKRVGVTNCVRPGKCSDVGRRYSAD
jgi:hypothetical protein